MKTTLKASFLLAFCLLGSGGFAQEPELSPVALNSTPESVIQKEAQKPLTEVLKRLEKKYGIFFVYNTKALEGKQVFEPGTYPANPEELLQSLLNQVNLQFERLNQGNYAIKKRVKKEVTRIDRRQTSSTEESVPSEITPLSLISGNAIKLAHIAEVAVTGVVKAADTGEGLPGVSVTVKGTTTGTTTDADGTFKLTVPDGNATLVFSFIGYTPEEVPVGNQTTLNITLAPDIKALSEVVVIGYGTGQRKTLSSSISTVKAAEIQNIPNANLGSLLQGRAPGVQVIQNNGAPGAGASIRIRGISSLRAGNDPLYVVDEVPILGNLADINPNDIESIDILKDASAIAIYGARAANGVVLITTKRGKGRTKVTLNTTYGIQNIAKKLEVLEAPELLPVMTEIYTNAGLAPDPFFFRLDSAVNVNWTDEILRNNAPIRTVDLSVSGKEGKVGYLTSINYFGQEGIIEKSGFNRVTGRLNLDVEVSKKLKFGSNLSIAHTKPQSIPENGNTNAGVYLSALVKNPFTPIYNASGGYNFVEDYGGGSTANPLAALYEVDRNNRNNRIFGNVFAEYKFFPELTFRTSWGLDYRSARNNTFNRSTSNQDRETRGTFTNSDDRQWINTNTLTYHKKFADVHDITALVVYEQQEFTDNNSSANASQFPSDKVTTLNAAAKIDNVSSEQQAYGLESFIGRMQYSYKDKYILTGTVRRDGSSRFGLNNRYGVFPSASVAWNIGDESFLKGLPFINFLKLRGSAGQVGNQGGLGNYTARGLYNTGNDYAGLPGTRPGQLPNYNLQWESTTQYNVGVDVGILEERIVFTAEAYLKKTQDLLIDQAVPQSAGTGSVTVNLGKMQNKGLEFNLTTRNLAGALKWTTNLNVAFNRNKILSLYGSDDDLIFVFTETRVFGTGVESALKPGNPVGVLYGYVADGIYARDEDNTTGLRASSATGHLFGGGDVRYVDQDGNGVIEPQDRVTYGRTQPLHTGGITNTFAYKGLSLDIFMNWSYGNQVYNATRQALTAMSTPGRNYLSSVRNRWKQQGDITDIPRAVSGVGGTANYNFTSTRFLEDGSYLRLSNVTLGYELPQTLVERLKFQNIRAFITANNLALFTKYSGIDPDVRSFTREGHYGTDFGAYPRARTFTVGLTLGL